MNEVIARLLVNVTDTGGALDIGRSSVYELFKSGDLTPIKIGRRTLVAASEIEEYVERLRAPATEANGIASGGDAP